MSQGNEGGNSYHYSIADDETASRAAFRAVVAAKECDPLELPPIGRTIDTEALDALVDGAADAGDISSTFEYAGCSVTVTGEEVRVNVR